MQVTWWLPLPKRLLNDIVDSIDSFSIEHVKSSRVSELMRVGACLPEPVPAVVFRRAFGMERGDLEDILSASGGTVRLAGKTGDYLSFSRAPTDLSGVESALSTLSELLNFIESNSKTRPGMEQCRNALALFQLLSVTVQRLNAERMFGVLDKPVKSFGDKQLVIDVAIACIYAVTHEHRTPSETECEARARICGLSWAYQRKGRLDKAAEEAERSLELARLSGSEKNLAFGMKCTGRLARLRAEAAESRDEQKRLFQESEENLRKAVDLFSKLADTGPDHEEVGDCYSLLGRTCLSRGDTRAAERWAKLAAERLHEGSSKDYLDLQILNGELAVRRREYAVAHTHFREVVGAPQHGDYPRSEIIARALMQRARLYVRQGEVAKGQKDYERAENIWKEYGDGEFAAEAHWEAFAARHKLKRSIRRVWEGEPSFAVRAAASRRYEEEMERTRSAAVSLRNRPDDQIVRKCLREARKDAAQLRLLD